MAQRARGAAAGARPAARRGAPPEPRPPRLGPDLATLRARIRDVVEPLVLAAELDLEDLTVSRAGRRHVVRITIDGDAGMGHDELGDISREISAALDAAEESGGELTSGAYTLEVSSPGIDRPLTLPRHWRRTIGRLVTVRAGDRHITARVVAVDEGGVTFETGNGRHQASFGDLGPGRVQVEFNRVADADLDEDDELDGDELDGDELDGDGDDRHSGNPGRATEEEDGA